MQGLLGESSLDDEVRYNCRIGSVWKNMKQRGQCTDDKCPCCEMIEDMDHIFICKNHSSGQTLSRNACQK